MRVSHQTLGFRQRPGTSVANRTRHAVRFAFQYANGQSTRCTTASTCPPPVLRHKASKVEVLSNNLANVNTVGFKRELALLQARDSEAIERGLASRGTGALEDVGGGVRMNATFTDFSPGTMQLTHIPTDLAIDSPNTFFQVQHGDQKLLTRAGNFHVSNDGTARDSQRRPGPVQRRRPDSARSGPARCGSCRRRRRASRRANRAGPACDPKTPRTCKKSAKTTSAPIARRELATRRGATASAAATWKCRRVNPVEEMVELITASRAYEANVRMIQQHDTATSELISRMLKV